MAVIRLTLLTIFMICSYVLAQNQIEFVNSKFFGRVHEMTYDKHIQNRVYGIIHGNHILVSNDNGINWEVFYAIPEGEIYEIRLLNNGNSMSFILRLPERFSIQILDLQTKTINKSFEVPYQGADEESIVAYSIFDDNTDIAVVGITYRLGLPLGKVFYTSDGGTNWETIYYSADHEFVLFNNVVFSPHDPKKIYLARSVSPMDAYGGLLISNDAGITWTERLEKIAFDAIAFHPENPDLMWLGSFVQNEGERVTQLFKSFDGGDSWVLVPVNWTDFHTNNINAIEINPYNPDHIIVLEENEVAISYDGGASWENFVSHDPTVNIFDYYYGTHASFNPFNPSQLFITCAYYPMISNDGGESMSRVLVPFFNSEGSVNVLRNAQTNDKELYYGFQKGIVYENLNTNDFVMTEYFSLNRINLQPRAWLHLDRNIPGRLYLFSTQDYDPDGGPYIKVSNDNGLTTHKLLKIAEKNEFNSLGIFPNNPNKFWAAMSAFGGDALIYEFNISDLENPTYTEIMPPSMEPEERIMYIEIDPENENNIMISQGINVYRTTDGGASWNVISHGLDALNQYEDLIISMSKDPFNPNHYYMTTTKGIFQSMDGGINWERMTEEFTNLIASSNIEHGNLVAVTYTSDSTNFKISISKNHGESWRHLSYEDLYYIQTANLFSSADVDFYDNKADVYVSTADLGIIKYTVDFDNLSISEPVILTQKEAVIYPNPASDFINISSKGKVQSVEIYNFNGQKIMQGTTSKLNISHLPKGNYIVKVLLENGKTESQKLIKK